MKTRIFIILILLGITIPLYPQNLNEIEGEIIFNEKGKIYIYLVDDASFNKKEFIDFKIIEPNVEEYKKGKVYFSFKDLKSGTYSIRCFQDTNRNNELDKGIFGPKEPWGMSWKNKKPFGRPPVFDDISFNLISYKKVKIILD